MLQCFEFFHIYPVPVLGDHKGYHCSSPDAILLVHYRIREKFWNPLVHHIEFGCSRSKSACPKRFVQTSFRNKINSTCGFCCILIYSNINCELFTRVQMLLKMKKKPNIFDFITSNSPYTLQIRWINWLKNIQVFFSF